MRKDQGRSIMRGLTRKNRMAYCMPDMDMRVYRVKNRPGQMAARPLAAF
jgi:hypothetical protein